MRSIQNYRESFLGIFMMKTINISSSCECVSAKNRLFNRSLHVALSLLVVSTFNLFAASDSTKHWVGTWACAPYKVYKNENQPPMTLTGNTLRQIVRVSIGGDTLRIKFSNITYEKSITIQKVTIAKSPDATKSAIDVSTITGLTFNGKDDVTIAAKSEVYSDPVAFDLDTSMRVAVTIYYGECETSTNMTFHWGSRGNSYFASGDKTSAAVLSGAAERVGWFTISAIDVLAPKSACSVAAIGNSITDGAGIDAVNPGLQNRWTDRFSEALLANETTREVGVLNLGIGATKVTSAGNGAESGVDRFQHDVLEQSGLKWVIIFYGVNDLGAGVSADGILAGIKKMADMAHAKDPEIKVYGATITPFQGYKETSYTSKESVKNDFNSKLPKQTFLDGVIDFAKAIADPSDPSKMLQKYRDGGWNDGLHPGPAGHQAMGKSIDLKLFTPPLVGAFENTVPFQVSQTQLVVRNGIVEFKLPQSSFVSLKVYSLLGKEVAELAGKNFSSGKHTVELKNSSLTNGTYIYSLKTDRFSTAKKIIFPAQ
ncbi:MAG: T9SS type A sorting domain-containing protein [Chitinispirillaceae bacterium]|nr:T9SS type A sorting domain-containing protein [Chitinispirillaceae bacterium]